MTDARQPPPSPGVAARRKGGPKTLPKLPLSIFTPPNSGTGDKFPLPPSPSAVHPQAVVDAQVVVTDATDAGQGKWKSETEAIIGDKATGIVATLLAVDAASAASTIKQLSSGASSIPTIAISVPFPLERGAPSPVPAWISASSSPRVHLRTSVNGSSEKHVEGLSWALEQGYAVDVDVDVLGEAGLSETAWETLEDFVDKGSGSMDGQKGSIILSNILPPPHSLSLPIVKLLNHPDYLSYQNHISSISLFAHIYLKFLPPAWGEQIPSPSSSEASEWKRRIKMYLGPAVEAFGYERIIFGSSPSHSKDASTTSHAGNWYELARQSFAELGLEQRDIDAVFCDNAKRVYAAA